ncbi:MAG: hypothetical protein ACK5MQ_17420 [Pikeienuella sp.]
MCGFLLRNIRRGAMALALILPISAVAADDAGRRAPGPPTYYRLMVRADNMFLRVYVNDAPAEFRDRPDKLYYPAGLSAAPARIDLEISAEGLLRPGENRVVIDYVPFDPKTGAHEGSGEAVLQVQLMQMDMQARKVIGTATFLNMRWDPETRALAPAENDVTGRGEALSPQIGLIGPASAPVDEAQLDYRDENPLAAAAARRLGFSFTVDDPGLNIPPFSDAETLEDTPALRADLLAAYVAARGVVTGETPDAYIPLFAPVLETYRYTTGWESVEQAAAEMARHQPMTLTGARRIKAAPTAEEAAAMPLLLGPEKRLVAFAGDPIQVLEADGRIAPRGRFRIMFCRQPGAPFRVCHYFAGAP